MSKTVKTLYKIGLVVSIVLIAFSVLAITFSIVCLSLKDTIAKKALESGISLIDNKKEIEFYSIILLIGAILLLLFKIAILILAIKQKKHLDNGAKGTWPYIVLIVIGVLGNFFFVLCGIFGSIEQEKLPESEEYDNE